MPLASPTHTPSVYSASSTSNARDGKRYMKRKDFQYKHGQRHHSYDKEKAPYPLSYDKQVLEIEAIDNRMAQFLRGSISFVSFDEFPTRVLDLGCGVGFDLVDIQIPLHVLHPSISSRIEWKHGNFLTTKLPFPDDEFDHVHIQSIAMGVPENKWGTLFEEICRILRPGGSVEVIEDDIVFPTLPRWFTQALRARSMRPAAIRNYPDGASYPRPSSSTHSSPSTARLETPPHDHALLESLFISIYENPNGHVAVLPIYLTTYFRQVALGPIVKFPMPPLPPVQPLPPQIMSTYIIPDPASDILSPRASTIVPSNTSRGPSLSFSSTMSTATASTTDSNFSLGPPPRARTTSAPLSYNDNSSMSSFELSEQGDLKEVVDITTLPLKHRFMVDNSATQSDTDLPPGSLFPLARLEKLNDRSLAMQLYRAYQGVLACREAMWEELKDRIRNRKDELLPFGWEDDEELEELQSRKKFEKLIDRYRSDMEARVSFWCSLETIGWPLPAKEPLSKAELIEAQRLRESMIEARKQATMAEMMIPCRSVRVIVGYKL
ncbi:hypothetical protein BDN70DRAFT_902479 [Pholiota conissans]|uniref:Methyltransferase domain-containing protein n=1 Tax=Pholiota conissans TaxID=109636 RepID=A0A9P5ZI68_9AGAR|nr:hypothetical protein BDN70DRAFT_902479 [Pholiota conissans]